MASEKIDALASKEITTNKLTVNTLFANNGSFTSGAAVLFSGSETIAAGGTSTALDLTKTLHHIDADAGGDIFTIAAGAVGQLCICTMESGTGTATITPVAMAGGTSVTLNAAGDSVTFIYQDSQWYVLGGNSYTVI